MARCLSSPTRSTSTPSTCAPATGTRFDAEVRDRAAAARRGRSYAGRWEAGSTRARRLSHRAPDTRCGCASTPSSRARACAAWPMRVPLIAVDAREVEQPGEAEEFHSPYFEDGCWTWPAGRATRWSWRCRRGALPRRLPGPLLRLRRQPQRCRPRRAHGTRATSTRAGQAGRAEAGMSWPTAILPSAMAVPKQKQSSARARTSGARRHKISAPTVNLCPQCHSPRLPHRVCPECGLLRRPSGRAPSRASSEEEPSQQSQ